jgi:hypothetical protein
MRRDGSRLVGGAARRVRGWGPSAALPLVLGLIGLGAVASVATESLRFEPTETEAPAAGDPDSLAEVRAELDRTAFRVAMLEAQAGGKAAGSAAPPSQEVRAVAAAVALLNLREQARTDRPFATDLALARPLLPEGAASEAALAPLAAYAGGGVPSIEDLAIEYARLRPLLRAQVDATAPGGRGWMRAVLAAVDLAQPPAPDPRLSVLEQVATELERGRLADAVAGIDGLDPPTRTIASGWLAAARVRLALDASVDALLRGALAGLVTEP